MEQVRKLKLDTKQYDHQLKQVLKRDLRNTLADPKWKDDPEKAAVVTKAVAKLRELGVKSVSTRQVV